MSGTIAVAGVTPRDVAAPRDIGELAETVRALHAERKTFAFVGGGTELELGNAPRSLDTVVRTTSLDRVIEYAPEDQLITVEAGMTFAKLDGLLAEHDQMLPLGVADRERATVGGAVATNAYGRRRQRYGTMKDLIVGVEIVRADGVRARGGGKVVKTVAGFDLPKLMVGSLGTLGAIVSVTLRVYPVPEARRTFVLTGGEGFVEETCRALVAARLEPEAVVLYDGTTLVLTFAGTQAGVDAQVAQVASLSPASRAEEATPEQSAEFDARERAVRAGAEWRFQMTKPPHPLAGKNGRFVFCGTTAGAIAYPLLGLEFRGFDQGTLPVPLRDSAQGPYVGALRAAVRAAVGGDVVVHAMPPDARGTVDAWGPPPPSLPLMRAIKTNFDPLALCNPGRFIGGL